MTPFKGCIDEFGEGNEDGVNFDMNARGIADIHE